MAESFPHLARIRAKKLEPKKWQPNWGEIEENQWYLETTKKTPYHKYLAEFSKSPKMIELKKQVLDEMGKDCDNNDEKLLVFTNFPARKSSSLEIPAVHKHYILC